MNHENYEKTQKKKVTTEGTENTKMGFDGLVGLFEHTQTAMQKQAARSVDIALVVRNWLFVQMYVNYFDRYVKLEDEKPTVGILLCLSKSDELVELTLPENANIYASEYQLYLPDKKALKRQLEEVQAEWEASEV